MIDPITRTHRVGHANQGTFRKFDQTLNETVEQAPPWPHNLTEQQQRNLQRDGWSLADAEKRDHYRRVIDARHVLVERMVADADLPDTVRGDL